MEKVVFFREVETMARTMVLLFQSFGEENEALFSCLSIVLNSQWVSHLTRRLSLDQALASPRGPTPNKLLYFN